jgi:hypothetical protein
MEFEGILKEFRNNIETAEDIVDDYFGRHGKQIKSIIENDIDRGLVNDESDLRRIVDTHLRAREFAFKETLRALNEITLKNRAPHYK